MEEALSPQTYELCIEARTIGGVKAYKHVVVELARQANGEPDFQGEELEDIKVVVNEEDRRSGKLLNALRFPSPEAKDPEDEKVTFEIIGLTK